ncbi:MAG: hypothetical protein MI757_11620, partial [Pirellulales bacterium]|nr:hypothetical protein [Pirellulales bacterium]
FVNGSPTTLATLARLGQWLVDIHGPHDHQSLLHPARQLDILDAYGGLEPARERFGDLVEERVLLEERRASLIVDDQTHARQLDLLRHQVAEISEAGLSSDDEETLEAEHLRAGNAARLAELTQNALSLLEDEEPSLSGRLGELGRLLRELRQCDPGTEPIVELHEQAAGLVAELRGELSGYGDRLDIEPGRLRELEARLDLVQSLKRKYGGSVAEILAFGEEAGERLASLERREEDLAAIDGDLRKLDDELWGAGGELSKQRGKVAPKLRRAVEKQLRDLGFAQSRFDVALDAPERGDRPAKWGRSGLDRIEFQFAPNPGEPLLPLRAIASSGEMARVMLALKTVLAAEDRVPVLVFDEIDANVGGETAGVVGEKMRRVGRDRQALCVTHLAPVAAAADTHFVVDKRAKDGRTVTEVRLLKKTDRVAELARMLGGRGSAQRKHAEALLKRG